MNKTQIEIATYAEECKRRREMFAAQAEDVARAREATAEPEELDTKPRCKCFTCRRRHKKDEAAATVRRLIAEDGQRRQEHVITNARVAPFADRGDPEEHPCNCADCVRWRTTMGV